ncbi:MAG: mercuric reductase [Acidobacteriaceae bacterium]
MNIPEHYHAVVIGSGQGGTPLSQTLAKAGMNTALIERAEVGGTCVNTGCTPTKTMVASARVAYLARRATDYGVHTGTISVDLERVRQRKRDIVLSFRGGSQKRLEANPHLDLIFGEARFTAPRKLEVKTKDGSLLDLSADKIFINTGTRTSVPQVEGLDDVPYLDNASIMELDSLPEHLLVLGGGYIGLEFGQMFRRFGSRVTIVQSSDRLLTREDRDVSDAILTILREDGINVLLNAIAKRVSNLNDGIVLELEGDATPVTGSHLLVATGRTPNSDSLNLASANIRTDAHGFISVDDHLKTTADGVWALGDVKGGPAFTHISYDDFRIIRSNVLEKKAAGTKDRFVPYVVFIDPQLGRIGITEEEARRTGRNIRVATLPMTSVARAIEIDETRGFMKAVVDANTQQILGASILGVEGGEVMAVIETAMMGKLPYTALRDATYAHPSLAESLNNLFMTLDEK